jgi:uncharacterized repeat protein (TIGR03806 family)
LRAIDGAGNASAFSPHVGVTTPRAVDTIPPSQPGALTATANGSQRVTLEWAASTDDGGSGLAGYRITRDGVRIADVGAAATTFTDTALQPATTYAYGVVAFDGDGNQSSAATATARTSADTTPPGVPQNVSAIALGSTSARVDWSAVADTGGSGLAGYRVFRAGIDVSGLITATTFTASDLAPATSYSFTVRAFDNAGNASAFSAAAAVTTVADTTAPPVPGGLAASVISSTQIDLTWNAVIDTGGAGLAGYRVLRNGAVIATVGAGTTTAADTGLSAGTAYTYRVRAFDAAGNESPDSAPVTATTRPPPADTTPPSTPALSIAASTSTSVTLSWTASTDAGGSGLAGYRVFRGGTQIATGITATSYVDAGRTPGTAYTYAVSAVDVAGNASPLSNSVSVTTPPDTTAPSAPGNLVATANGSTSIGLAWSASTDAGGSGLAGYRILRNGSLLTAVPAGQLAYSDTTVSPATTYTYVVRAVDNANNVSADSNAASASTAGDTTPPTAPANLVASTPTATSVLLTWGASTDTGGSGLAGYTVRRGGADLATGITGTSYTDPTVAGATTYSFSVVALDGAGNASIPSNTVTVTTPTPPDTTPPSVPQNVNASAVTASRIDLTWSASTDNAGGSGLAGYRILRGGTQIAQVGAGILAYSDTGLTAATTYSYVVRAFDAAGNVSASSAAATATTSAGVVSGLDARPPNTSCLAPNEPVVNLTVAVVEPYPSLPSFSQPLAFLQPRADSSRWYVVEKRGTVRVFNATGAANVQTYIDIQAAVNDNYGESGLLGMAFDPAWSPGNERIYLSYTADGNPLTSRVSRFVRSGGTWSEKILFTVAQPYSNHNGGHIAFGPDGYLYVGLGDGGSGGDPQNLAQNRNTLLGKLLRIDVSGGSTADYTIPPGNPYAGNPRCNTGTGGAFCPEIYAYGLRNPWRWSFDRGSSTPDIWLGDVGQNAYEEINHITSAGGNFGWRFREGAHCYNPATNCPTSANGAPLIDPVAEYGRSLGVSITGGYVYRGTAMPGLAGRYVFSDFSNGTIRQLVPNGGTYTIADIVDTGASVSSFGEGNDGELYVVDFRGRILKLVPGTGGAGASVPANLADTGCVDPSDPRQPASGLIPYAPNAPFWSDAAAKTRWMALPDGGRITIGADGDWSFPNRTVLVKNFALGARLIETRLFMKHADTGNWAGYTYQWNAAQTAATLVNGGLVANIGGQDWIYPSGAQCLQCHTAVAGRSLGLETPQLNGDLTYPQTGRTANQLATLEAIGLFSAPLGGPPASLPAYPDPFSAAGTSVQRARAYLHTNCAQCHRAGGPTPVSLDLRYTTPIGGTNTCNVTPQNSLGIAGVRVIAPGAPDASILLNRMNRRDQHAMPPVGSNLVDTEGVALIREWIAGMNGSCQ